MGSGGHTQHRLTGRAALKRVALESIAAAALGAVVTVDALGVGPARVIVTGIATFVVNASLCRGTFLVSAAPRCWGGQVSG